MNFNRGKTTDKGNSRFGALMKSAPGEDREVSPPRSRDESNYRKEEQSIFRPRRGEERQARDWDNTHRHNGFTSQEQKPKPVQLDTESEEQFPSLGGATQRTNTSEPVPESAPQPAPQQAPAGNTWAALAAKPVNESGTATKYRTDGSGRRVPIDAPETLYEREVRLLAERKAAQAAARRRRQAAIDAGEEYYSESDDNSVHEYVEEVYSSGDEHYDDDDGW